MDLWLNRDSMIKTNKNCSLFLSVNILYMGQKISMDCLFIAVKKVCFR